jgi:toxin-antitoxin system PIN domain toxin
MRVVDANVLLYAVNTASERHRRARAWLDAALAGDETVGFAWVVLLAFVRLSTHPGIFPRPLASDQAIGVVRKWLTSEVAVVVEPGPRHLDLLAALLDEAGTAANLVTDAHLAAIAIEHDATLETFDADFTRFAGLRRHVP